jgi:transcriptional regulator with PAS, ATPase and Fis domain
LAAFLQIQTAVAAGTLHITGETGSGKEIAARAFHEKGAGKNRPFVAVNCATIPEGVAERLLFGAKKGAYSGAATDSVGYVQEADGGTLFLDEIGELDLNVQAKLLRVLETREVMPLGASRPQAVDIRICSATHRDLREALGAGRFREDLFYRIGRPQLTLPPLRDRLEDIPFLLDRQIRSVDASLEAHVSLVEACLLRSWPGNVREILAEARDAALLAARDGATVVSASHLASDAGHSYERGTNTRDDSGDDSRPSGEPRPRSVMPPQETIEAALAKCGGRVATAARELGLHRNQLRRWLEKNDIDPNRFSDSDSE